MSIKGLAEGRVGIPRAAATLRLARGRWFDIARISSQSLDGEAIEAAMSDSGYLVPLRRGSAAG
jgi:hypothetical protein